MSRLAIYAVAAATGLFSLATASYLIAMQSADLRLLSRHLPASLAPLPAGVVPPEGGLPPTEPVLSAQESDMLARALWRDPLNPKLFNLLYTEGIRIGRPAAVLQRERELLSRLGWRFTPAQQNLMLRAAIDERYDDVVDRADALMRQQKLLALSYELLLTLEAIPEMQAKVVDRLAASPPWRRDYLSIISPQMPEPQLAARVATIDALIATPRGMRREEIAPSLVALAAGRHGRDAYRLWLRHIGQRSSNVLVYDSDFQQAAVLAGTTNITIPFEWHFNQDLGHITQVGRDGVRINWDGRGVPIFLSQTVLVEPGQQYTLRIKGRTSASSLSNLLAPAFSCGGKMVLFMKIESGAGEAFYRSGPLPSECDMAVLTISGALDSGVTTSDTDIVRIALQRES